MQPFFIGENSMIGDFIGDADNCCFEHQKTYFNLLVLNDMLPIVAALPFTLTYVNKSIVAIVLVHKL